MFISDGLKVPLAFPRGEAHGRPVVGSMSHLKVERFLKKKSIRFPKPCKYHAHTYSNNKIKVKAGKKTTISKICFPQRKILTKSFCRLFQQSLACQGQPSFSRFSGRSQICCFPLENHPSPLPAPQQLP